MKNIILTAIVSIGLFLTACNSTETKPANTAVASPPKTEQSKTPEKTDSPKPAETAANTAAITGVAACDEYLTTVEKFVNNQSVPQAVRDSYKQSLEQNRTAWKQAASTPQGKAALESGCKTALDAVKPVFEKYGK